MRMILIGFSLGVLGYGFAKSWMIIPSWAVVGAGLLLVIALFWRSK